MASSSKEKQSLSKDERTPQWTLDSLYKKKFVFEKNDSSTVPVEEGTKFFQDSLDIQLVKNRNEAVSIL